MKALRLLSIAAGALLAAACSTDLAGIVHDGSDLKDLKAMKPSGTSFNAFLALEYTELSDYEAKTEHDWPDSARWAAKGLAAVKGSPVLPEDPANKDEWGGMPEKALPPLVAARAKLVAALDGGGRNGNPKAAARAQVMYDCWVEEEEEAWQTARIAYCKGEFEKALAMLAAPPPPPAPPTPAPPPPAPPPAPAPQAAPAPAPMAPANFLVYFDFDSVALTATANKTLDDAAAEYKKRGRAMVAVQGHTDRSGSDAYNERLSKRRAEAVMKALVARGVPANVIGEEAFGETRTAVPTQDNVKEARNRRVEIQIK